MPHLTTHNTVLNAAHAANLKQAALTYAQLGISVIPLQGKRPALHSWKPYQAQVASPAIINSWHEAGLLSNIGLVCGTVSSNLVVLDLDGLAAYPAFAALFPDLSATFTVATGSGQGYHVYWRVHDLPASIKAMNTPIGHLELCANGRQVVAPPSIHPDTGQPYRVAKELPLLSVPDLQPVLAWIEAFRTMPTPPPREVTWRPPTTTQLGPADLNPALVEALTRHFQQSGFKSYGEWLHGRCIYPEHHQHGDRHPSFGFNTATGYGHCYVCGTLLAKDICARLGIDPATYGGLIQRQTTPVNPPQSRSTSPPGTLKAQPVPPHALPAPPAISELELPPWLAHYVAWAGGTGNQTPLNFHLGAGLWLLSAAIGRRLYARAPWGINIHPNLYLMFVAETTYYRKSTAYQLAQNVAQAAIPHMLMPTPGSPERFLESLSGRMPTNFDRLPQLQQARLRQAQPFAAQRGLIKDEVAALFGSMNRRDYMTGMKDLLMELYDCPDYVDKDTQAGLTIVQNAALSILGVTTPANLTGAISAADWSNGLLIRFALLTPEVGFKDRPLNPDAIDPPPTLINGLRQLYERLPAPEKTEEGFAPPQALRLKVDCWPACQSYGNVLRQLCAPDRETELDERLKGVYGRMHVQALKVAELIAALRWLETDEAVPTITEDCWRTGRAIAELWRHSAERLLNDLDRSGRVMQEQRDQNRVLRTVRRAGPAGLSVRQLYRNLNLQADRARTLIQDLARDGQVIHTSVETTEWVMSAERKMTTV